MTKVFLSHDHGLEAAFINALTTQLLASGVSIVSSLQPLLTPGSRGQLIHNSDAVIAILGQKPSNSLLEVGFALGAGKPIILLTQGVIDVPEELKAFPYTPISTDVQSIAHRIVTQLSSLGTGKDRTPPSSMEELANACRKDPSYVDRIDEKSFEGLVQGIFEREGLLVKHIAAGEDTKADFIIRQPHDGKQILVAVCKLTRQSKVSIGFVAEVVEAARRLNATAGLVVTSGDFTNSAIEFAECSAPRIALASIQTLLLSRPVFQLLEFTQQQSSSNFHTAASLLGSELGIKRREGRQLIESLLVRGVPLGQEAATALFRCVSSEVLSDEERAASLNLLTRARCWPPYKAFLDLWLNPKKRVDRRLSGQFTAYFAQPDNPGLLELIAWAGTLLPAMSSLDGNRIYDVLNVFRNVLSWRPLPDTAYVATMLDVATRFGSHNDESVKRISDEIVRTIHGTI